MVELISVIVPVYKVEKYLVSCVTSVMDQSYRNLEIILVDDGSPDKSGDLCDTLAAQDERIVAVHKPNGGLSDARNAGIEMAKGDYLFFLDSDDTLHEETLEILWKNLKGNLVDISGCDYLAYVEGEDIDTVLPEQRLQKMSNIEALRKMFDPAYGVQMVICTNKLYKKALWETIRFPIGKIHEDEFTTYRLLYKAKTIVYTDLKLYYYLQRSDSITGTGKISRQHFQALDAFSERTAFFETEGLKELTALSSQQSLNHIIIAYQKASAASDNDKAILQTLKERFDATYRSFKAKSPLSTKDRVKNDLFSISPVLFRLFHNLIVK